MSSHAHSRPQTQYARSGDVNIAYQVVGHGNAALDLVFVSGWVSNVEYMWEDVRIAHYLRRPATFSRLIVFDKRGAYGNRHSSHPSYHSRAGAGPPPHG